MEYSFWSGNAIIIYRIVGNVDCSAGRAFRRPSGPNPVLLFHAKPEDSAMADMGRCCGEYNESSMKYVTSPARTGKAVLEGEWMTPKRILFPERLRRHLVRLFVGQGGTHSDQQKPLFAFIRSAHRRSSLHYSFLFVPSRGSLRVLGWCTIQICW